MSSRSCASALLLSALLIACAPRADLPADIAALRAKAEADGAVRVIARLEEPAGPAMADARASFIAGIAANGIDTAAPLSDTLPLIVAELSAAQLDALYATGQVSAMMEDALAYPSLAQSGPLVQAPQTWALGARGRGQSVAILDTGVDAAHPFLAGRVTGEACFSTNSAATGAQSVCPNGEALQIGAGAAAPCTASGCEHGTHVAGIAAGRSEAFSGMAPDAEIIAIQVFSRFTDRPGGPSPCGGRGPCVASFTSDQIRALDHVRQLAATRAIASANMSLGGGRASGACDTDLTKPVIDQLRALGIATVIAAGNDGFPDSVSRPGCISTAVTVGATTKQDQIAGFSNRGPQVDLLAPGVSINSSITGGRFSAFSGTSMAAPHVAGAFAALRSLRPASSLAQIETAFATTGAVVQTRPRLVMLAAAQALPAATEGEARVAQTSEQSGEAAIAALGAYPQDEALRMIVQVPAPAGATGAALAEAVAAASSAARAAGASHVAPIAGQPLLVIEATPRQAAALARSGAVGAVQVDEAARPQ